MRRVLEAMVTHPRHDTAGRCSRPSGTHKLFWINTGPFNNLTARKFVLDRARRRRSRRPCTARFARARPCRSTTANPSSQPARAARSRSSIPTSSRWSRTRRRAMGRTSSRRAPTTSTTASRWPTSRRSRRAIQLNSRLVKTRRRARRRGVQASAASIDRRSARDRGSPREAAFRSRRTPLRAGARRARAVLSQTGEPDDRRQAFDIAWVQNRRFAPWTR